MRASRLVSVLLLLQARGQMTAGELARELEVSERTIHRDVEALSASGVPIYAERGVHGGIRLVDGYRTRLTGHDRRRGRGALPGRACPGPAAELGLGTVVAAAQLKILASLPPELRARASRLVERFHLDAGEWFRTSQPVPHLGALSEAVWEATRIAIDVRPRRHRASGASSSRSVSCSRPGSGTSSPGSTDQVRTYRVARVLAVEPRGEPFERPAGVRPGRLLGRIRGRVRARRAAHRGRSSASAPTGSIACGRRSATASSPPPSTSPIQTPTAGYASGCGWTGRRRRRGDCSRPVAGSRSSSQPEVRARLADTARAIAARYAADRG